MSKVKPVKKSKGKLHIPDKEKKRHKGYYLSDECIAFVKAESKRLTTKEKPVSENEVLTAIIMFYKGE